MKLEHWLALRYISSPNKPRSLSLLSIVSIFGIALGVAALVVVICVMSGFQSALERSIWQMTGHIVIMEKPSEGIVHIEEVRKALDSIRPKIKAVAPVVYGEGMLVSPKGVRGVVVEGIEIGEKSPPIGKLSQLEWVGENEILLGSLLAEELGVKVKDNIKFVIPLPQSMGGPKIKSFQVAETFQSGMYGFDAKYAFIPFQTAQALFQHGENITALKVYLNDVGETVNVREYLNENLPLSFFIRDWREFNYNLFTAISQQKVVISLLIILIIIVAAFNVASSLFMLVMDKKRAISCMRAMGGSPSMIVKIFTFAGGLIGCVGTFLGIFLGLIVVTFLRFVPIIKLPPEIYHFQYLPVEIRGPEIIIISLVALIICLIATLYPAVRAGNLKPLEGIRYE